MLTSLMLVLLIPDGSAHICGPCDNSTCPEVGICPGGQVFDLCECCPVCARQENDTCGGQYGLEGRCDDGLTCAIEPDPGAAISGHEVGVCTPSGVSEDCDMSLCPEASENITCANDTREVGSLTVQGQCCPPTPICQCLPCPIPLPLQCPSGTLEVTLVKGTGIPAQCCDVIDCVDKEVYCENITCPGPVRLKRVVASAPIDDEESSSGDVDAEFSSAGSMEEDEVMREGSQAGDVQVICPPDSQPMPPLITHNGCCVTPQKGCECNKSCPELHCPEGSHRQVTVPGTGQPGMCCDMASCVSDLGRQCTHAGVKHNDGTSWSQDECTSCSCRGGLTFCAAMSCESPGVCGWVGVPEGQCCPVCRGCVADNGERYSNGEVWGTEDGCQRCRCEEGRIQCQAHSCSIQCTHPRRVPGMCCPVCDNVSMVTLPPVCPLLLNCTLLCSSGLVQDTQGCYQCLCNPEIPAPCDLSCPAGLKRDPYGYEICECQLPEKAVCPKLTRCQKTCAYGYRINKQGCPRCRCNKCPQVSLCKKKCPHGYVHNDKGCRLCRCQGTDPVTTLIPLTTLRPPHRASCMSFDGRRMEDGESWYDGCRRCFCHDGHEMCALITCPVPRCRHPVIKPSDCCPSCGDQSGLLPPGTATRCHTEEGQQYAEGETWDLDECTRCICHDGGILCEIESCPPILCHHPVKLHKRCCPICPDGTDFLPAVQEDRICTTSSGVVYKDGDSWRVSACQSCTCRAGQIHCFSQTCPLPSCNRTILKKGQCCPHCMDEVHVDMCSHDGVMYRDGESWLIDQCTTCLCEQGHSTCTSLQCPTIHGCTSVLQLPEFCCPVCQNKTKPALMTPPGGWPEATQIPGDQTPGVSSTDKHQLIIGLLATIIVILCLSVTVLIVLLLRTRRKTHLHGSGTRGRDCELSQVMLRHHDYSVPVRPKSTNVQLQGTNPLPGETQKIINEWHKPEATEWQKPATESDDLLKKEVTDSEEWEKPPIDSDDWQKPVTDPDDWQKPPIDSDDWQKPDTDPDDWQKSVMDSIDWSKPDEEGKDSKEGWPRPETDCTPTEEDESKVCDDKPEPGDKSSLEERLASLPEEGRLLLLNSHLPQSESKLPIDKDIIKFLQDFPNITDPDNFRNSV